MIVARVLVGESCEGKFHHLEPPRREVPSLGRRHAAKYDTTTDSMDDARRHLYVTFHDNQAYPEYVIHFRRL